MNDEGKDPHNARDERKDEDTDSRTLSDIEAEEKVPSDQSESPVTTPDEASGRPRDSDSAGPI